METQELREKLTEYIKVADEKKIAAIYTLVEDEIEDEHQLWKDEAFVTELDERVRRFRSGEDKSYTEEEAMAKFRATVDKHITAHV